MMRPMRLALLAFALLLPALAGLRPAAAQAPPSVPVARYWGTLTIAGRPAPAGTALAGMSASDPASACGLGTVIDANGTYVLDDQSLSSCTGSGITILVNGIVAGQSGAPPATPGGAIRLDLAVGG